MELSRMSQVPDDFAFFFEFEDEVSQKVPYKTDKDTLAVKYRIHGDRRISNYYE